MPKKIELTLPEPPSVNRIWRMGNGRTYKDPKARDYAIVALAAFRKAYPPKMWNSPLFPECAVRVTLHWFRSRKSGDLDNRAKGAMDALNGLVWADDKQIEELHLYRHESPRKGRIDLTIEAIE